MIAEYLRLNIPLKDKEFDVIYPADLRKLSPRHFTEVAVAIKAAELLVSNPSQKVLDIGCGAGKFCFVASASTSAYYTGVDYRSHFIEQCKKLSVKHRFHNVKFLHSDIKNINLREYDCFYFFNSFQEHIDQSARLDETIETNQEKFKEYSTYLKREFDKLPEGTRIVTYHAYLDQIPNSYALISKHFDGLLKCWEKTANPIGKLL